MTSTTKKTQKKEENTLVLVLLLLSAHLDRWSGLPYAEFLFFIQCSQLLVMNGWKGFGYFVVATSCAKTQ